MPGFKTDVEGAQCGECVDEDQTYPDCSMKTKAGIVNSPCTGVPNSLLPKYMKDSSTLWKEKVGDVREFVRTYTVRKQVDIETLDLPVFDETTVIKIFFKGSKGLNSKVKIIDSKDNVIFESTKLFHTGSFTAILDPEVDEKTGEMIQEKGYVIFEYTKNSSLSTEEKKEGAFQCWSNEVVISMNPYTELIQNSK